MTASLLFDLDGTIAETDWAHLAAFQQVFSKIGIDVTPAVFNTKIMGQPNVAIGQWLLPEHSEPERVALLERKEAVYREIVGDVEPIEGLVDLLQWAASQKIPCAVVTNAPRINAEMVIDSLGIGSLFSTVVLGPELERSKPDPLPYLTGLKRLGGDARRSVAFEDSPTGMQAALAAGLPLVGMTTNLDAAAVLSIGARIAAPHYHDTALWALVKEITA